MFVDNKIFAILFISFLPLILVNHLLAQTVQQEPVEENASVLELENELVLLRNATNRIPLLRLDTLKALSITLGLRPDNSFQQTLNQYLAMEYLLFDEKGWSKALSEQNLRLLPPFNQVIIGLNLDEWSKFHANEKLKKWFRKYTALSPTIVVVFGTTEGSQALPTDLQQCAQLIYVPDQSPLAQSLAAQLIFGALGAKGTLEKSVGEFKQGSGLVSAGGLRLRYSPPERVGLSATLLRDSIAAIAKEAIAAQAFPGMQVLVAKDGHIVFHETYGHATFAAERVLTKNDLYDLASVSKITTALPALMKLHGEGQLDLDAPLKQYFPKAKKSNKAALTFRNILAHQARLKPWIPYWKNTLRSNGRFKRKTFKEKRNRRYPTQIGQNLFLHRKYRKQIYRAIFASPLNEKSGYKYSGLAFYLFPEMVSEMTNQSFETYLQTQFYRRLGATSLGYHPLKRFTKNQIIPTEQDTFFRKELLHGYVHDEGAAMMGGISANAGLFGNANDLAKLLQMYLNKGTYGGERYIASESIEEFTRCQFCETGNRRGLGFDKPLIEYHPQNSSTAKDASPESYGHSGYTGTFVWVDPAQQLIYIFLSNRVHPTRENRQIYQRNIRPRIHQVIYNAIK